MLKDINIISVNKKDTVEIKKLFLSYLVWACEELYNNYNIEFNAIKIVEEDILHLEKYLFPYGKILLVKYKVETIGIVCIKKLNTNICEIKRMFIKKEYRRQGIGKKLIQKVEIEAKKMNYQLIRLDSAKFMKEAHILYENNNYDIIEPYKESEIPKEFHKYWIFMEKKI